MLLQVGSRLLIQLIQVLITLIEGPKMQLREKVLNLILRLLLILKTFENLFKGCTILIPFKNH